MIALEVSDEIVAGLIGAFAVLLGVLGESWAGRVRARREATERAASALVILLPHVIGPISVQWVDTDNFDTGYGSEWSRNRDEVQRLLFEILQNARWPMRRRAAILDAANETAARLAAHTLLWITERSRITTSECFDMYAGAPGGVLSRAKNLDDRVTHFDAEARRLRGLAPRG